MTDQDLENRLRAWYRAEIGADEVAPPALRTSLAVIPRTSLVSRRLFLGRRGLALLAAAAVLTAILIGSAIEAGSRYSPIPTSVQTLAPASPTASPSVDPQVSLLEANTWSLDFEQSGLSPQPLPGGGPGLASSLQFVHGKVEGAGSLLGGTGYGGGCDHFSASYAANGPLLTTSLPVSGGQCDPGSAQLIRARVSQVAAFTVSDCGGPPVYAFPSDALVPMTSCHTLRLFDGAGRLLLVYHTAPYSGP